MCLGWSAWVDAETVSGLGVGPWQYQSEVRGGWWVGSTLPCTHPPIPHPAGYPPPAPHCRTTSAGEGAADGARMVVLACPKEILGVDNARVHPRAQHGLCRHWRHLTAMLLRPAPWRLLEEHLSHISVYLSISQYSVFLGYQYS